MTYHENLSRLANIIRDYRYLPPGNVENHIDQWLRIFPEPLRLSILDEMTSLMSKTYISRENWKEFIAGILHGDIAIGDKKVFWASTKFLNIQRGGNSQREMLESVAEVLNESYDLDIIQCGSFNPQRYIYVDDGIFSGNRVVTDLKAWLETVPNIQSLDLIIVTAILHTYGNFKIMTDLKAYCDSKGIHLNLSFWRIFEVENRRFRKNVSDVLWPKNIPNHPQVQSFMASQGEITFREGDFVGPLSLYSTPQRRELLEEQFMIVSTLIRDASGRFGPGFKPLGFNSFRGFGFGSTFVTFRNCPNNCPLVFWAEIPFFHTPLFLRNNN